MYPGRHTEPALNRATRPIGAIDGVLAAIIILAVLAVAMQGIASGGLGWSDAPNHALDGVFMLEFARELPLDHPRAWAEEFYLRHPILGIVVYWPPGFAVVEAAVFAVFGVNIAAARATVLLFAIGAGLLMYALGRRWFDRPTGLFAALLLITCPHGVWWANDVMLEWPATFWILAVVYAYQADRDGNKKRWCMLLALAVVMAFLTKQTAGFILPVILLHALLAENRRRYLLRPRFVICVATSVVLIAAYILIAQRFAALPSQLLQPSFAIGDLGRWTPEILGWPLLPVAMLGLVTFMVEPNRSARGLLLIWFLSWTLFCLCISAKEPRYLFFSIPPIAFATARFLIPAPRFGRQERELSWRRDAPRLCLLAALVITQTYLAKSKSVGRLPDYAVAVSELAGRPDADLVLVDAVRDGQFIFDAYQNVKTRDKLIPIRASKLLYARAARAKYNYQQFVETEQDIVDLLDKYGIRYIVIESALPRTHYTDADPPPRQLLRHLLASDSRFELIDSWPLQCGDPIWDDVRLELYAYPTCPARESDTITFSMPGMGGEVTLELPSR